MTKDKRLHIRITEDMQEKLKAAADKDGRTVANLVTKLITDYLEEEKVTRTIEQLEEQVKEITTEFYNDLEKEFGIEFTTEEVQAAIRSHQDTIDFETEKDLSKSEFEKTYREWMEDRADEIVDARVEEIIE